MPPRQSAKPPGRRRSSVSARPKPSLEDEMNKLSIADLTAEAPLRPLKKRERRKPFHFLMLPSELRLKIYAYYFDDIDDDVFDLGPDNHKRIHKRLGFMRVCKQIHDEATFYFYSTNTFRIFPTFPGRYFKSKKPLLARMKPIQRQTIQTLQLRLGPGFDAPPRGWVVNDALGLRDCVSVKKLLVFVQIDPTDSVIKGFRRSECIYGDFCRDLLTDVLDQIPSIDVIEFDGWPSVKKSGNMMQGLLEIANESEREICWGPERGWTDSMDDDGPMSDSAVRLLEVVDGIPISSQALSGVIVGA